MVKNVDEKKFPLQKMERNKLFINENLTQASKRLLWLTKQKAKAKYYSYTWTMNGRIYVRKDDAASSTITVYTI